VYDKASSDLLDHLFFQKGEQHIRWTAAGFYGLREWGRV